MKINLSKIIEDAEKAFRPVEQWHGPGDLGPSCDDFENNHIANCSPEVIIAMAEVVRAAKKVMSFYDPYLLSAEAFGNLHKTLEPFEVSHERD